MQDKDLQKKTEKKFEENCKACSVCHRPVFDSIPQGIREEANKCLAEMLSFTKIIDGNIYVASSEVKNPDYMQLSDSFFSLFFKIFQMGFKTALEKQSVVITNR